MRAAIFDIYGTLLIAPPGAFQADPDFDPVLNRIFEKHRLPTFPSPSARIADLIRGKNLPEIDLTRILAEVFADHPRDFTALLIEIEAARLPLAPMPGAHEILQHLASKRIPLGLLSNAQANTLPALDATLGRVSQLFHPQLTVLSYQHLVAKPAPELFQILIQGLASLGISPSETLYVGNDPIQDIAPAARHGLQTALFTGHSDSLRLGDCTPSYRLDSLSQITPLF